MKKVLPSKLFTEYRARYGVKNENIKDYVKLEVSFSEMDSVWVKLISFVDSGMIDEITCSTPLAHFYFRMEKAVIAVYTNNEDMKKILLSMNT